jgi:hypothetical protein
VVLETLSWGAASAWEMGDDADRNVGYCPQAMWVGHPLDHEPRAEFGLPTLSPRVIVLALSRTETGSFCTA